MSCDYAKTSKVVSSTQTGEDVDMSPEVKNIEQVIVNFLIWYKNNESKLSKIQLVNNASGLSYDSTKFYSVNFDETEKYLSAFNASGFVSIDYLNYWRDYFKKADVDFKKNPENDGPPANFDYDLVMRSQDTEEDLKNADKTKIAETQFTNNTAITKAKLFSGHTLNFTLTKQQSGWKIDKIENTITR